MQSYHRFQHVGHTAFNTSGTNGPRSLSFTKAGIHSALGERSHTAAHTPKHGRFGWGWYHYPRSVPHVSETLRGRSLKRQTLPLLGLGRGCSRRTQKACGTAMRLCVSLSRRRRGPAGLRDLFSFLSKLRLVRPALRAFPCVRGEGWYHYPQRALRAAETLDSRLSKRLSCHYWGAASFEVG